MIDLATYTTQAASSWTHTCTRRIWSAGDAGSRTRRREEVAVHELFLCADFAAIGDIKGDQQAADSKVWPMTRRRLDDFWEASASAAFDVGKLTAAWWAKTIASYARRPEQTRSRARTCSRA